MKRVPIPGFPGYAITKTGEVWRVEPSQLDSRFGPVPRKLKYIYLGSKGRRHAAVSLSGQPGSKKTVLTLLKATFPSGGFTFNGKDPRTNSNT